MNGINELKRGLAEEYVKTHVSLTEIAEKYGTSLSTTKRIIKKYGNTIKAEECTAEDWKQDITGYYVSNKGRVKDKDGILIKCFKSYRGLATKLTVGSEIRQFYIKDLMFRTFNRPIADNEYITTGGKMFNFGLGDLKVNIKKD